MNKAENRSEEHVQIDYYDCSWKRIFDFFLGCFLAIVIAYAFTFAGGNGFLIALLVEVGFWFFFYEKKRKYITIGMISFLIVPLLLFGSCLTFYS